MRCELLTYQIRVGLNDRYELSKRNPQTKSGTDLFSRRGKWRGDEVRANNPTPSPLPASIHHPCDQRPVRPPSCGNPCGNPGQIYFPAGGNGGGVRSEQITRLLPRFLRRYTIRVTNGPSGRLPAEIRAGIHDRFIFPQGEMEGG